MQEEPPLSDLPSRAREGWEDYNKDIYDVSCFIDTFAATSYLGRVVVFIYRAEICPDNKPLGCTMPVAEALTAFAWVGAWLATAVEDCSGTLHNYVSSCAESILRDMASAGSLAFGIDEDCFLTNVSETEFRVFSGRRRSPERRLAGGPTPSHGRAGAARARRTAPLAKLPGGRSGPLKATFAEVYRNSSAVTERNFDKAQCSFDVALASSWLMRALMKIRTVALRCPHVYRCGVNVVHMIGAFAYASQFMNLVAVDCPYHGHRDALCGADISETIGSFAMSATSTFQAIDACSEVQDMEEAEREHEAAEAKKALRS